jgi:histidinol-phosphatase (PHP family)
MISHRCDYHIHTPLCHHAIGWPIDYARRAVELGLEEIGISDHSPMPEQFDDWRMALADLPRYLESVDEARAAFPQLKIRLGLEVDYLPAHEPWIEKLAGMAEWDYFIGSVHYLAPGWDVDNPRWIGRFRERPVEEIWTIYTEAYVRCIRSGLFDFVAHPDLVKKFGFRPEGDSRRFYEPIVAALAETQTPFEINTAGLRKDCRELYPAQEFLELAQAAGVPLLINSDAHAPGELGADFDAAVSAARNAGFTETLRFERRVARSLAFGGAA